MLLFFQLCIFAHFYESYPASTLIYLDSTFMWQKAKWTNTTNINGTNTFLPNNLAIYITGISFHWSKNDITDIYFHTKHHCVPYAIKQIYNFV